MNKLCSWCYETGSAALVNAVIEWSLALRPRRLSLVPPEKEDLFDVVATPPTRAASPSPLNGERARVRGEAVRGSIADPASFPAQPKILPFPGREITEHHAHPNRAPWLALLLAALSLGSLRADSLWVEGQARSMVADKRALAVGDILSIVVQESSTATKDNSTKTAKKSSIDAKIAAFLYSPDASSFLTKKGQLPAVKLSSQSDFDGGGKINNSERIVARIAVRVVDVLPNQNLVVEGRRQTSFSGETQEVVLRGVVRPADIAPNNTVFSYNVADASIRIISKGTVADSQRKGWFTRLWDKLAPF